MKLCTVGPGWHLRFLADLARRFYEAYTWNMVVSRGNLAVAFSEFGNSSFPAPTFVEQTIASHTSHPVRYAIESLV